MLSITKQSWSICKLILVLASFAAFALYQYYGYDEAHETDFFNSNKTVLPVISDVDSHCQLNTPTVHNGHSPQTVLSYSRLVAEIYAPIGFEPTSACQSRPWLAVNHKDHRHYNYCHNIFAKYIEFDKVPFKQKPPPKWPPKHLLRGYTMEGTATIHSYYINEAHSDHMSPKQIWSARRMFRLSQGARNRVNFKYGAATQAVYKALDDVNLTSQRGAVIGSRSPWLEAILFTREVSHITTIEYAQIAGDDPRLTLVQPVDFARTMLQRFQKGDGQQRRQSALFDFVVSFSSIEHSGLGRYGDTLDPRADILEVQKAWCMLKPGGIFVLGLPFGIDHVAWNAHRIYGRIRLPLVTAGFDVIKLYPGNADRNLNSNNYSLWPYSELPIGQIEHVVMVLRKR